MTTIQDTATHHESIDVTRPGRRPSVLMVVANPATSTTTGWPVGFWAAELFHPLYEFDKVRYRVTVASPEGGRVELDALSDPRDESRWSADDLISMGALNTPEIVALLERTPKLADLDLDEYDALVVCGGQGPMFQFRDHEDLKGAIRASYEAEKPTAALCHGVCALLDVELSDGSRLIDGKKRRGGLRRRRRRPAHHALPDRGRGPKAGRQLRPRRPVQGIRDPRQPAHHRPAAVLGHQGRAAGDRVPGRLRREVSG
jgi:putative intracellular protease/amidase